VTSSVGLEAIRPLSETVSPTTLAMDSERCSQVSSEVSLSVLPEMLYISTKLTLVMLAVVPPISLGAVS
jgi:hypothetical protein